MKANISLLTRNGIFIAIILLMGFFPQVGFVQILPILPAFTLIHIPVLLGAYFSKLKGGLMLGFTFGLVSLLQALLNPGPLNAIFIDPFISVLPRVLFGATAGFLFQKLNLDNKKVSSLFFIAIFAFILTILHTVFVLSSIVVFIGSSILEPFDFQTIIAFILPIVFVNGVGEALLAALIVPLIVAPISKMRTKAR